MELNKNHDRSNTNNTTSTNANNDSTVNRNKNETKANNTFQALQSPNMNAHMHPINSPLPPKSVKKTPTTEKLDDIFSLICSKMGNLSTDGSGNKTEMVDAFVSVLMCSESEANFFLESTNWDVASAVNIYLENRQLEDSEFETELMTVNDSRKRQRNQLYASNSYANAYNNDSFMSNHIGNNSTIEHNSLMSSFGIGERYGNHNNHNISNVNDSSTQLINNSNESSINESIVGNVDVEEFNVHIGCNREDVNRNPMSFNLHPYENKEVVIKGLDRATWRAYVNPISGCIYFLHLATNYKQDNVPPGFADNPLPQSTQPELSRDSVCMSDETSSDRTDGSIQAKNDSHSTITSNSISDSNKSSDDSMTSFPNASSMDTSENPDITNTNQRSD